MKLGYFSFFINIFIIILFYIKLVRMYKFVIKNIILKFNQSFFYFLIVSLFKYTIISILFINFFLAKI